MSLEGVIYDMYSTTNNGLSRGYFNTLNFDKCYKPRFEVYNIKESDTVKVVVPLGTNPNSFENIYSYGEYYENVRPFSTINNMLIHSFSRVTLYNYKLCRINNANRQPIYYIGYGCILDKNFIPIMFSQDVYSYENLKIIYTIVKFNKNIFQNPKDSLNKILINKVIPIIAHTDRNYHNSKYPINIEICDMKNTLMTPKLYVSKDISTDINNYVAENYLKL